VVSSVYFCRKCAGGVFRVFLSQMCRWYLPCISVANAAKIFFFILKRNKKYKGKGLHHVSPKVMLATLQMMAD